MSNLVSGRQLRAARVLAGATQERFAEVCGYHGRSVRYWESKTGAPTSCAITLQNIEGALARFGVEVFSDPTPGARFVENRQIANIAK